MIGINYLVDLVATIILAVLIIIAVARLSWNVRKGAIWSSLVANMVIGAGGVTAALVVAFVCTHRLWYDGLPSNEKVNFWNEALVAYGTLALAVVTVASVLETQTVIRGEDRRHQQGFAPLLLLKFDKKDGAFKFIVSNVGLGIALKVLVLVTGEFEPTQHISAGTGGVFQERPNIEIPDGSRTHHLGALPMGGEAPVWVPGWQTDYGKINVTDARLEYSDMFGNEYVTAYRSCTRDPNDFRWERPAALRFRNDPPER